jgi:hypothetical protein
LSYRYFFTGAALAVAVLLVLLAAALLVLFLACGLVLFLVLLVLWAAGLLATLEVLAGVWAANVRGMVATANAITANRFFFIFSLPAGPSPAYISILRRIDLELDSLRRLLKPPNSGIRWLTFISLRN